MFRLSVLYGTPTDPEEFDRYYREVHIPLAAEMGLARWTLTWTAEQEGDLDTGIHLVADLYAEDAAAMDAILASPAGKAAADDVPKFATGGVTFLRGTEEVVV
ncbi:MAG: EthD family reductase [Actinomycetota bacterium]